MTFSVERDESQYHFDFRDGLSEALGLFLCDRNEVIYYHLNLELNFQSICSISKAIVCPVFCEKVGQVAIF